MSALSHVNASSAVLAIKAFAIATGIVAVGGTVFVWGVKETLGVQDVNKAPFLFCLRSHRLKFIYILGS